jgi:hypothetical protein
MSKCYVCKSCLNDQELYNAVVSTPANEYKIVNNCFDCRQGLSDHTINEIEVLTLLDSQESYSNRVEQEGAYAGTTLELIRGIMALDPENDEEYNDYALIDLIELAIKYHRNHKDKD